jgi:hypothetical protein
VIGGGGGGSSSSNSSSSSSSSNGVWGSNSSISFCRLLYSVGYEKMELDLVHIQFNAPHSLLVYRIKLESITSTISSKLSHCE